LQNWLMKINWKFSWVFVFQLTNIFKSFFRQKILRVYVTNLMTDTNNLQLRYNYFPLGTIVKVKKMKRDNFFIKLLTS
jgi:hypothetical protein